MRRMEFLTAAENKESFLRRVARYYPTLDWRYKLIEKAYNDAHDAFQGVYRDDGATPYFTHILAVALILLDYLRVRDHEMIVAALLHDIVEDKPEWTIERVRNEYGDQVAYLLEYLSKEFEYTDKVERERVYHTRFETAPRGFFLIKLADRFHNLYTLWACDIGKQRRKVEETKRYYLPYAEKHQILIHELEEAIKKIEQGWAKKV